MEGSPAGGAARFSCPPNFTATPPASDPPRFSLEALTSPDTEVWLIQAPADFAPHCLNGRRVPLSGSQIVKGKLDGRRHCYQVLSSSRPQAAAPTLLAPSAEAGGGLICAPAPRGSLRIIEGPQESQLPGIPLQPVPASVPPQIPSGLRPRFSAFGGSPPVTGPGSALALSSPTLGKKKKKQGSEVMPTQDSVNWHGAIDVGRAAGDLETDSRKKKRKKQVNEVKAVEPLGRPFPAATSCKKKKRSKGAEIMLGVPEPRTLVELEAMVAAQTPDGAMLSPTKKRKRQKEAEGVEPVEGTTAGSQPQVSVEPQEEAMSVSPKKKSRKEKRQSLMTDPGTEAMEPELLGEPGLQGEAVLVSPKKKKKEKPQTEPPAQGVEVMEVVLPADLEPQVALASTKKKEKAKRATEPDAGPPDSQEPEAGSVQRSKKRKKDWESGVPDAIPQAEMPGPLLEPASGEVCPTERKKKQKRKPHQEPAQENRD